MYSIRPIISACMTCMVCGDAAVYYRRGVVCLYVYLLNKMAEPVEMPFGLWTWVGPRNHALVWGPDPPKGSGNVGGHVPIHCKVLAGYTISRWRDWYAVWDEDSGGHDEPCFCGNTATIAFRDLLYIISCIFWLLITPMISFAAARGKFYGTVNTPIRWTYMERTYMFIVNHMMAWWVA